MALSQKCYEEWRKFKLNCGFAKLALVLLILIRIVRVLSSPNTEAYANFSEKNVHLLLSESKNITLEVIGEVRANASLTFNQTGTSVVLSKDNTFLSNVTNATVLLGLYPRSPGYTVIYVNATPSDMVQVSNAFTRVSVSHSDKLDYVSDIVGWIYLIAWSVSFYPQTYINWKRKSVVGFHFDFLSLNTVGFLVYSIFNIGLYFVKAIENEYFIRHPFGINPVQLNDVVFSTHAFIACLIQVGQCFIYERGDQKVSQTARSILSGIFIGSFIMLILSIVYVVEWLDFLYFLAYVKLFITLIKYVPQAYYNYERKSTYGWSIGNIMLDFTGGTFSIAQMFILSYNYNDWGSIFGDPTKFGLGLFSIAFDIFFMIQHYILYSGQSMYSAGPQPSQSLLEESLTESDGLPNYGALSTPY